jgi:oligoendopeptidase F
MAMELLAAPELSGPDGLYSSADAARARVEHLEEMVLFWPYMAVVDAFQHWAYTRPDAADDPRQCDAQWQSLWRRFIPGVDWSGLEAELVTGWQRRLHIFRAPLYYVEYGLAALGAAQVWRNSLADPAAALADYRAALTLGGTAALPQLFAAAGARFAFDAGTLGEAVRLIERAIAELEAEAA